MGAPTSSIFSEIYLQHKENTKIIGILFEHHILVCFRYVDNILVVNKNDTTYIHDVLDIFNSIIPITKFTMGDDKENKTNFMDITISEEENNISFNIYRKPTTTDTVIPNNSCHPQENKLAAIRYLTNRMETYNLNVNNKVKEANTIKQILNNNKYDPSLFK
jgi:hypothetical protein